MNVSELPIDRIVVPPWNPNEMDQPMRLRLRNSVQRNGIVVPLVVRKVAPDRYETIGGAQRLSVLKEMGFDSAPCVVVEADEAEARLLSQALNHISGQDNLGLRAEVVRYLLDNLSQEQVLAVLPDSSDALKALASLGQDDIAQHMAAWQKAQSGRLRHLQLQLTDDQLQVIEEAVEQALANTPQDKQSPNRRGTAFTEICRAYLSSLGGNR